MCGRCTRFSCWQRVSTSQRSQFEGNRQSICGSFVVGEINKIVGVARQQRHFLCGDKENEAKESLALRWACLAREFLVVSVIGINL